MAGSASRQRQGFTVTTVTLDDEVQTRFQAIAAPDEALDAFVAAAARDALKRREHEAAGRAEMQAMIDGPWHTLEESNERMRLKYNLPDLSHMTREELEEDGERIIAAMDPQVREKLEREGWL